MITFGNPRPLQVYVSRFDASSVEPTKHLSNVMSLSDSASRGGSIWARDLSDVLGLTQSNNVYHDHRLLSDALSLIQLAVGTVDRPAVAASVMTLTDSFIYAGTASAPSGPQQVEVTFDSDAKKGMVVYVPSSVHADLAQADAVGTTRAVGLAVADVSSGALGSYVTEGLITLADWTDVIGSATLTSGEYYYLSEAAAGKLVSPAPTATGEFVVAIGRALSTTILDIEISQPILL
jgi:hypothetical protein